MASRRYTPHIASQRLVQVAALLTALVYCSSGAPLAAVPDTPLQTDEALQLVAAKCSECHGADGIVEGELNLLEYKDEAAISGDADTFGRVREKLETREMPPPGSVPLTDAERSSLLQWIDATLLQAHASAGGLPTRPVMRRLTRLEYNNSVRDLLKLRQDVFPLPERLPIAQSSFQPGGEELPAEIVVEEIPFGTKFPSLLQTGGLPGDNRAEHGFNNRGDELSTSPMLLEKYLAVTRALLDHPRLIQQSPVAKRLLTEPQIVSWSHLASLGALWAGLVVCGFRLNSRRPLLALGAVLTGLLLIRAIWAPEWSFDFELLAWGMLALGLALTSVNGDRIARAATPSETHTDVRSSSRGDVLAVLPVALLCGCATLIYMRRGGLAAASIVVVFTAAQVTFAQRWWARRALLTAVSTLAVAVTIVACSLEEVYELRDVARLVKHDVRHGAAWFLEQHGATVLCLAAIGVAGIVLSLALLRGNTSRKAVWCTVLVAWSVALLRVPDSPMRIIPVLESSIGVDRGTQLAASNQLTPLISRAFRRAPSADDMSIYMSLFDRLRGEGLPYRDSMSAVMQAVLCSPRFVFMVEDSHVGGQGEGGLSDFEFATRLSYFLWSSLPDEELLAAAQAGRLHDDHELEHQIDRMLRDQRASELSQNFAVQWLKLQQLFAIRPSEEQFPAFYAADDGDSKNTAAIDMLIEPLLMFQRVIVENRSILEFVDAEYTYVNRRLAGLYGIDLAEGTSKDWPANRWQRVSLADRSRGGLLTMAAPLAITSYPERTSPVRRGAWVLEAIYNRPPDEPKMAAVLDAEPGTEAAQLTVRERLERHRTDPACSSCHSRIDPPGFALEGYDPIGVLRTHDGVRPVDTGVTLPDGTIWTGPIDFKEHLRQHPEEFVQGFVEHLLSYALGRQLGLLDYAEVRAIMEESAPGGYRFRDIIHGIVKSRQFRMAPEGDRS